MGLAIESKTVNREKRYMGFNVQKGRDGQNSAYINVATGYYDTFNGQQLWVTEFEETISLSNDQLAAMFSIKPAQLGLTSAQTNLFSMLDTAMYAVISEQLPIKFKLTVTITDGTTALSDYIVHVVRNNQTINTYYVSDTNPYDIEAGTLLGATIKITKYGFEDYTKTYQLLNGNVSLEATLAPVSVPSPEPVTPDPEATP